jgi:predicted O-methyltransferase YrrM
LKDPLWAEVDRYFGQFWNAPDPALDAALAANAEAELPAIDVAPNHGRLLHLLARMMGARRILEIGTLGGYSTICLARALPEDGQVVTLESNPKHAEVARTNLARAGVADRVDIRVGPAIETLPTLTGPFDFVFIDADKPSTAAYFEWALKLARPGTVIVIDNVVREGTVIDPRSTDPNVIGMRRFHEQLAKTPGVYATTIQTVGVKKHDGFTIALVS